jgi:ParB family transcriptional regulator, chromosome partitioning protein
MAKNTSRLGKGLSALIPARDTSTPPAPPSIAVPPPDRNQIRQIPIDGISPNRHQPRTTFDDASLAALAESIRVKGILQPIVVRSTGDHTFELVAGERRWRAARIAGLQTIPAMVREFSDSESFETALIENLQREDLGPLERASAYQHYLDAFGGTIEDLAQRLSESRANVSNYLRLLKLCPEICFMLGSGELSMGHARAIAGITDSKRQIATARLAVRRNLSVRQVEDLARTGEPTPAKDASETEDKSAAAGRRHLAEVEQVLTKTLGLRVRLRPGRRKNSGRVVISYASLEEFDRLAERLGAGAHLE